MSQVWYASYGSNMDPVRLRAYIAGGCLPPGRRTYPGCRDTRMPSRSEPIVLPGRMYFALESPTWTGGLALYDPDDPGETPAAAHLVTAGQFADIAAQEMRREPGADVDLGELLRTGRASLGPGRYDTLVCHGDIDGMPVVTFTAPWRSADVEWNAPVAAYLGHVAAGLVQTRGWSAERVADYLVSRPGAAGAWERADVMALAGASLSQDRR
ncbi:MAG: histone deacetylase [Streptosporangiales bacterium]|nr:histone deacetylase [Streptosporangiales bacterium]